MAENEKGVTIKEMCEVIAQSKMLTNKKGEHPTAEQVFKYSPTGELFDIFFWYPEACKILGIEPRYSKAIIKGLVVNKDRSIEIRSDMGEFTGSICGRGQPSRDYSGYWIWDKVNNTDKVYMYISSTIKREDYLPKLTAMFESVDTIQQFIEKYEGKELKI